MAADAQAWLAEGREILARQSGASWEFADWLASDDAPEIADREIAEAVGVSRRKIGDYRTTSIAYAGGTRMPLLTFSHHRCASKLPEEARSALLSQAASGAWPVSRLRGAVRAASLEGRVLRQTAEIRELRRLLRAAEIDARTVTTRVMSRLKAERGVAVDTLKRYAASMEELAEPELLDRLHGNARTGIARGARREVETLVVRLNAEIDRIGGALAAIEGPPPAGTGEPA